MDLRRWWARVASGHRQSTEVQLVRVPESWAVDWSTEGSREDDVPQAERDGWAWDCEAAGERNQQYALRTSLGWGEDLGEILILRAALRAMWEGLGWCRRRRLPGAEPGVAWVTVSVDTAPAWARVIAEHSGSGGDHGCCRVCVLRAERTLRRWAYEAFTAELDRRG